MNHVFNINQYFEDGEISMDRFHEKVRALLGGQLLGLHTRGDDLVVETVQDLNDPQIAALKAIMAEHRSDRYDLAVVKSQKCAAIDRRTRELMAEGFVAHGLRFSLSVGAQLKLLRLDAVREELDYPVFMNTIDDATTYKLEGPVTLHEFVLHALMRVHDVVDGGTDLKNLIRAAPTPGDVARIADPR